MTSLVLDYQTLTQDIEKVIENAGRKPDDVKLVAVSKYASIEDIQTLRSAGVVNFGESRVQQLLERKRVLSNSIRWHMIGSLQRKKVKKLIGETVLIHSVDSMPLAEEISKRSEEARVKSSILLEVNCSGEATKHGFTPKECLQKITTLLSLPHITIQGLMTMAPLTDDREVIRSCFASLRQLRDACSSKSGTPLPELSMGMSNDYRIAIQEGSTMLRIGSALFGS